MTSPLAALDALIAPLILAANVARQARDNVPVFVWALVPAVVREPLDLFFERVEDYERLVGRLKDAGLS